MCEEKRLECPHCHQDFRRDNQEEYTSIADHGWCSDCHRNWKNGDLGEEARQSLVARIPNTWYN
jgi:hypothetical protein